MRCAIARGERNENVGPPFDVAGRPVPSQNCSPKGRSGRSRSTSDRTGAVLAKATSDEATRAATLEDRVAELRPGLDCCP